MFVAVLAARATSAAAQTGDTVAVVRPPVAVVADTLQPPISPKRAFFFSLLFPGASQNRLGRNRVAVGMMAVEMTSIAMIRESGADVRQAKRQFGDSLVISYLDADGAKLAQPQIERRRFEDVEISSRRSHVEDWVALLIANHLFAAADGFVSASLWDVNARVTIEGNRDRFYLTARVPW